MQMASPLAGHWLVADMDGCLTPTPTKGHGHYMPLSSARTLPSLRRFIQLGGSLCVVSTAGRRMWRQIFQDLRPTLLSSLSDQAGAVPGGVTPGRLALCGFSGAVCFLSDATSGLMRYVRNYGGSESVPTLLDEQLAEWGRQEGRAAVVRFFELAAHVSGGDLDRARTFFAQHLSRKYVDAYTKMLENLLSEWRERSHAAEVAPCFDDSQYLRLEELSVHGRFLKETNDALVDVQRIPRDDGTMDPTGPAAQISVMGIPMALFHDIFFPAGDGGSGETSAPRWHCSQCSSGRKALTSMQDFEARGLLCKSQPNSVCIARAGVDKGICVRWLTGDVAYLDGDPATAAPCRLGFDLGRAIAFGDIPQSVDRPLTQFPPMPFVSLSTTPERDPSGLFHVGGEEEGTAAFLEELLESIEATLSGPTSPGSLFSIERVAACAQRAKARLLAERQALPP